MMFQCYFAVFQMPQKIRGGYNFLPPTSLQVDTLTREISSFILLRKYILKISSKMTKIKHQGEFLQQ